MFSPVAPAHRVSARERFAARPGVDVLSPRGSDAALRLSSLHDRLASTRSGRWTGEGSGRARPTAVSWESHRFLRKQHEVRTNAYSGGGSASARSIAGLDRSPGRINFARLPWHDNELSVRLGASRDMRGTTTPHHNDGTVGKDTRMRQQLAFPGGYERGNLRGGLPVHPRADVRPSHPLSFAGLSSACCLQAPSDQVKAAYEGSQLPDNYNVSPVENSWMRETHSTAGWSQGRRAGNESLERRTLQAQPVFPPVKKLERWQEVPRKWAPHPPVA